MLKVYKHNLTLIGKVIVEKDEVVCLASTDQDQKKLEKVVREINQQGPFITSSHISGNQITNKLSQLKPNDSEYLSALKEALIFRGFVVKD